MDDLDNPLPVGSPPTGNLSSPLAIPAGAVTASKKDTNRQQSDQKYQSLNDFMSLMPKQALEARIAVYRALPGSDTKADHRPELRISKSDWEDLDLRDPGALASYLEEKQGPGYYLIEPQDAQNKRIEKISSWTQLVGYKDMEEMLDDDDFIDDIGSRNSDSRRDKYTRRSADKMDDLASLNEEEEDPKARRANMMDYLAISADDERREVESMKGEANSMMSVMMMSQREDAQSRREESRLREERSEREREERRRQDELKEERRRDTEKREWESRLESQRREEDRRQQEYQRQAEAASKRTEMMLAAFTAGIPIIKGMMDKKEDPIMTMVMSNAMKDKGADPVMLMLLKNMMDKQERSSGSDELIKQMGTMSSMSSKMMADQMGSMMSTSNKMQTDMMANMYKQMLSNPGASEEDKSNWAQIIEAIGSASGMVGNLLNSGQQAPQAAPHMQYPMSPQQVATQQQALLQQQQQTQAQKTWGEMTEEERQRYRDGGAPNTGMTQEAVQAPQPVAAPVVSGPHGAPAVVEVIYSLHQEGQTLSAADQNTMIEYMIQEMPMDLRTAIKDGNQESLMEICAPIFMGDTRLMSWVGQDGVNDWLEAFLPTVAVNIERMESTNQLSEVEATVVEGAQSQEPAPVEQVEQVEQVDPEDDDSPV